MSNLLNYALHYHNGRIANLRYMWRHTPPLRKAQRERGRDKEGGRGSGMGERER